MEAVEINERRRVLRQREFRHAKIMAGVEYPESICEIRNLSAHGAELRVGSGQQLPEEFELHIRADQKTYRCRQVWRDGTRMGVEFIGG